MKHKVDQQILRTRLAGNNFRKAEALALGSSTSSLEQIRTHISRGNFQRAEKLIHREQTLDSETLQEQVRLQALNGNWVAVLECCESYFNARSEKNSDGVSQLTWYQLAGLAAFELGKFELAKEYLHSAISLGELFHSAPTKIYSEITLYRIAAIESGYPVAMAGIQALSDRLLSTRLLNLNYLVAILRAVIEMRRLSGFDYAAEALACATICKQLGDDFYQCLSELDYYISQGLGLSHSTQQLAKKYPRAQQVYDALSSGAPSACLSHMIIKQSRADSKKTEMQTQELKTIFITSLQLKITLGQKVKFEKFETSPQLMIALMNFRASQELSKEELFRKVWIHTKYVPSMHAHNLKMLLMRLRKKTKLAFRAQGERVQLTQALIV